MCTMGFFEHHNVQPQNSIVRHCAMLIGRWLVNSTAETAALPQLENFVALSTGLAHLEVAACASGYVTNVTNAHKCRTAHNAANWPSVNLLICCTVMCC